jgi:hypothetical protein
MPTFREHMNNMGIMNSQGNIQILEDPAGPEEASYRVKLMTGDSFNLQGPNLEKSTSSSMNLCTEN